MLTAELLLEFLQEASNKERHDYFSVGKEIGLDGTGTPIPAVGLQAVTIDATIDLERVVAAIRLLS